MAGFHAAKGILTAEGGKASHAALVARGMGKPCVSGAAALEIDLHAKTLSVNGTQLGEGDMIAIDGSAGVVTADDVPLEEPEVSDHFETVLGWADELRTLGVRTNADTPEDARRAREFGAEGIGLCRTEHMFMAADRQPKMRAMIMAETRGGAARRARRAAAAPAGGLRGPLPGDGGPAGHDPPARPAAPRVPAAGGGGGAGRGARPHRADRRPRGARAHARAHPLAVGDEPDARHARRAPRRAPPRDLRDADPRDLPRRARHAPSRRGSRS